MKAWRKTALIAGGIVAAATTMVAGAALADQPTSEFNPLFAALLLGLGIALVVSIDDADSN